MIQGRPLATLVLALALGSLAVACRSTKAGNGPPAATVAPVRVDPEYQREWEAVQDARSADPAGSGVVAAADRLLARAPPLGLRLAALHAKVASAYLQGDDAAAQRWGDEAVAAVESAGGVAAVAGGGESALFIDLQRLSALAAARSGEPERALAALSVLEAAKSIDPAELWAARALARERQGRTGEAFVAYAEWRSRLADGTPEARYAEERVRVLGAAMSRADREGLAAATSGDVSRCLAPGGNDGEPAWLRSCQFAERRIGVLLPRSGRLSALADQHLAAAVASVRVLAGGGAGVEVVWVDSGSTAGEVRTAAEGLRRAGVDAVVGPVGTGNVGAATRALGKDVLVVVPGEASDGARGVAPTLEERCSALVAEARRRRLPLVILAPENGYGKRAGRAVERAADALGVTVVLRRDFPESTTSFAPVLDPALGALRQGAALVILDRLDRMELVLRQAARDGLAAAGNGKPMVVLSTGESLEPVALGAGHEVLEGVWLAPAAWTDTEATAFAEAFRAQEGHDPGDQALLVWRALATAWQDRPSEVPRAVVVRVQGGRLVVPESQVAVQPRG